MRKTLAQVTPDLPAHTPVWPCRAPPAGTSAETQAINIQMWNCAGDALAQFEGIAKTGAMHLGGLFRAQETSEACLDAAGNGDLGKEEKSGAEHAANAVQTCLVLFLCRALPSICP